MRKMIPANQQKGLEKLNNQIIINDAGTIVEIGGNVEPEVLRVDALTQIKIKYNQAAVDGYVEGPTMGSIQGNVIATGVTSITPDEAHGGAFYYEESPAEGETANVGEIKVMDTSSLDLKFFWNNGGTYYVITPDLETNWAIKTNAEAVFNAIECENNNVVVHTAAPAKSGYKELFRYSLGDFQVAELDSEDGYKTL